MEPDRHYDSRTASILLVTASLILMANGILNMYRFSMQFGVGVGAIAESYYHNISIAPALMPAANLISTTYQTIMESALASAIAFIMFVMAFMLFLKGPTNYETYLKRYVPLHMVLTLIYLVLIMIMSFAFSSAIDSFALYMSYLAIAVCIVIDIYLEYSARRPTEASRFGRGISINPLTPYSNLVRLREMLFGNLSGEVGIVDKHFNSAAMANLHRLLPAESGRITSLRILTSEEMLDSKFSGNYQDLKSELKNIGIDLELRIMSKEDSLSQHERFIFDSNVSYKIPPLSIINKKSEHIVKMSTRDAKTRFDYLCRSAIKLENYSQKQGRSEVE